VSTEEFSSVEEVSAAGNRSSASLAVNHSEDKTTPQNDASEMLKMLDRLFQHHL